MQFLWFDGLAAIYAVSAAVVAPIHSGGGSNLKVSEALAHGRAYITTEFAFAALADCRQRGRDLAVARGAAQFAELCIELLRSPERRNTMGATGFEACQQQLGREQFLQTAAQMARSMLRKPVHAEPLV